MAKITDLVKTYRALNDPNAPDWNIKFIGAVVIAFAVVAAASAVVWSLGQEAPGSLPAAASTSEPEDPLPEDAPCASTVPSPLPTPAPTCAPALLP